MKKLAIFASGEGTNAEAIANHLKNNKKIQIVALVVNRSEAGAVKRMEKFGIPHWFFGKDEWKSTESGGYNAANAVALLKQLDVDAIALAGFLPIVPSGLLEAFPDRIVNIHPSLLPKFGGKGMWGMNVHEAVVAAGEKESGITIHIVSPVIDGGKIIRQEKCTVESTDDPHSLAEKVHVLEHAYFPETLEKFILDLK